MNYLSSETVSFLLPLRRRFANTLRPLAVDILFLNPCLLTLFLREGWYVLFILLLCFSDFQFAKIQIISNLANKNAYFFIFINVFLLDSLVFQKIALYLQFVLRVKTRRKQMDKHYINRLMQLRDEEFDLQILLTVSRLIERYPYFSLLYVFKVKAEKVLNRDYSNSLSQASVFFSNRLKLKDIINSSNHNNIIHTNNEENEIEEIDNLTKINQKIEELKKDFENIGFENKNTTIIPDIIREIDSYSEPDLSDNPTKEELIERFLQIENPKVKSLELSPIDEISVNEIVKKSVDKEFKYVTETMADIFLKQGHKEKAIEIYNKLILANPEKSTYFANRIEEIKRN